MFIQSETTSAAKDSILDGSGQDILRSLEHDWRRMCGNVDSPAPLGPDPYRMDLALPHMFILQRTGPGIARIRVAGQRLHDLVGHDPRGGSFGAFFSDGARDTALELLEAALTLPAIVRIPLTAPRGLARKPYRGEALLLPMRSAQGDLDRVMGVILTEKPIYCKTLRWNVDSAREVHCDTQEGHFPDRRQGPRTAATENVIRRRPIAYNDFPVIHREKPVLHEVFKDQGMRDRAQAPAPRPATNPGLRLVVDNTHAGNVG